MPSKTRFWRSVRGGALAAALLVGGTAAAPGGQGQSADPADWPAYGGALGDRYSTLAQINVRNVGRLQEAWRFETGRGGLQTNPLIVGEVLYGVTPTQDVFALDAASGRELWRFAPESRNQQPVRGLAYWRQGGEARLFTSHGPFLTAVDPATGRPAAQFGKGGSVDLREQLDRPPSTTATYLTSPGVIYGDLIIVGFRTSEAHPAAPGAVRAYDVRTGALRWRFNLIPRPGEFGHKTWPADAWKTAGGANAWAGMVVDPVRGIVYVPTGSAVDDFYGGDRPGDNLFANSLVALNARSGERRWHFQAVRHDIWDRDLPSPPVLLTVTRNGKRVDAVAQPTKHGYLFVLDRATGAPLFPIEERAVPSSEVPGERPAATQPFPLAPEPFARQRLTADMLTRRTPEAHAAAAAAFKTFRDAGAFTPFSVGAQTLMFPGFDGGADWGGPAVDRRRGVIFINSNDVAWTGGLRDLGASGAESRGGQVYQSQCAMCHGANREGTGDQMPALTKVGERLTEAQIRQVVAGGRGRMPGFPGLPEGDLSALVAYLRDAPAGAERELSSSAPPKSRYVFTGYRKFLDPDGYPAVAPPWGTLNAIDLNTGNYLWRIPLGEYPQLAAQGFRDTGCENYGGPVATAGGIVVIGATVCDRRIRAFDSRTGRLLWSAALPYAGVATPATYVAGGRQYIVIATSGQRDPKGPQGSAYVAFALPVK